MTGKILVTYATKHGATAEIAETIATVLGEYDLEVTLTPVRKAGDPAAFDAVIVGSAVYAGQWRKDAVQFVKRHVAALAERPVWLFSSGPTGAGDAVELLQGWRYPSELAPEIERIVPREIVVFHGVIDRDDLNVWERFVIDRTEVPLGDHRDWVAIAEWAMAIAVALGAVSLLPEAAAVAA